MVKSQTVISIRRDKVDFLREINNSSPNFFQSFIEFHSVSNYPSYIEDAIFISHAEHSNIHSCHLITPYIGSTMTNIFHKAFEVDKDKNVIFKEKDQVVENLIMGYKGVFSVENIKDLEIQSDFATCKNSVYTVFGFNNTGFQTLTKKDFDDMLDIVDFVEKDKVKEQENIDNLNPCIHYMGAFAQRQSCLAFQSDGLFKAYPFKSNKSIHLDVEQIVSDFKAEAERLNHRFSFADEQKRTILLYSYVSSYKFREKLSEDLFAAFIDGLKGEAIKIINEKDIKEEEFDEDYDDEPEDDVDDFDD